MLFWGGGQRWHADDADGTDDHRFFIFAAPLQAASDTTHRPHSTSEILSVLSLSVLFSPMYLDPLTSESIRRIMKGPEALTSSLLKAELYTLYYIYLYII